MVFQIPSSGDSARPSQRKGFNITLPAGGSRAIERGGFLELSFLQCWMLLVSSFICSGLSVYASQDGGMTPTIVTRSVSESYGSALADAAGYVPDAVADRQPAITEQRRPAFPMPTKGEQARCIAQFRVMEVPLVRGDKTVVCRYRLFVPEAAEGKNNGREFPLLVWLHGYGESGDDNWRHLIHIRDEVAKWEDAKGSFPCFVLAPQSPFEDHWGSAMEALVMQLVERTIGEFPIDADRIYLSGVSSGGNAAWQFGSNHPDRFAALVPMASASVSVDWAALAQTPVWAFRSAEDPLAPAEDFLRNVAGIRSQGGHCWLTETPGRNHDCWTAAFNDYHIIDWLLAQRRGEPVVSIPWWAALKSFQSRHLQGDEVWPPLAMVSVVAGLVWAVRRHLRLQHAQKNSPAEVEHH